MPDHLTTDPQVTVNAYRDAFGNWCSRIVAPKGRIRLASHRRRQRQRPPDPVVVFGTAAPVQDLPEDTLVFLLGSRYCETDHLSETAWRLFGDTPLGWARVQAICDSSMPISRSIMPMLAPLGPRGRPSRNGAVCAAISPTWR